MEESYISLQPETIQSLDLLQKELDGAKIDFEQTISEAAENVPSNLDAYDLIFCLVAGVAGVVLNNSERVKELLQSVHDNASITNPKTLLGKLLRHTGDNMDKAPDMKVWIDRAGNKTNLPHRIMWGHDIFSLGKDNPFRLLINQYGVGRGLFQAIRHLVADTCSAQGLPIPGSSWFDYSKGDGQPLGNRLIDLCNKLNKEVGYAKGGAFDNPTFNKLFSIHMQDVAGKGLTFGLTKAYIFARNINDEIRITQLHLLSTFALFYGLFLWNAVKTGMPSINWIAFGSMIKLTAQLYIKSNRKTKQLQIITTEIVEANIQLERSIYRTSLGIISNDDPFLYVTDYYRENSNIASLIEYFEEGD